MTKKKAKKSVRKSNLLKRIFGSVKLLFTVAGIAKANTATSKKGPVYKYAKIGKEIVKILGM